MITVVLSGFEEKDSGGRTFPDRKHGPRHAMRGCRAQGAKAIGEAVREVAGV